MIADNINNMLAVIQVFLKYYHIEQLSRLFEEQQRRIVLTQATIRMWIQRHNYCKQRDQAVKSALVLQRGKIGVFFYLEAAP